MAAIYPLIMAGGVGSRFWPYSRESMPKQFLDILGMGKSLLQLTIDRFDTICPLENVYIATNERYHQLVRAQCPGIPEDNILLEPAKRNTAPCITYGAFKIGKRDPKGVMVVAPSDHIILKETEFANTIKQGVTKASSGDYLITLGIKPTGPLTGYGYIRYKLGNDAIAEVDQFIEKPDKETAVKFLDEGNYAWNAGIFIWSVETIKKALNSFQPDTYHHFEAIEKAINTTQERAEVLGFYPNCEDISIDYAVMEKAPNVFVIPSDLGWSDLGSWISIYDMKEKDSQGNVVEGNVLTYDTSGCIIKSQGDKLIVVEGLEDLLVADHENTLLICRKDNEKKLKEIVKDVKGKKGDQFI